MPLAWLMAVPGIRTSLPVAAAVLTLSIPAAVRELMLWAVFAVAAMRSSPVSGARERIRDKTTNRVRGRTRKARLAPVRTSPVKSVKAPIIHLKATVWGLR